MIYTPNRRIPVGEPIRREDGTYALRVKRANRDEFDEITLDHLMASMVTGATENTPTGTPSVDQRLNNVVKGPQMQGATVA